MVGVTCPSDSLSLILQLLRLAEIIGHQGRLNLEQDQVMALCVSKGRHEQVQFSSALNEFLCRSDMGACPCSRLDGNMLDSIGESYRT